MPGRLSILGTRGIPAAHGGFETFAERLALYLSGRGWDVTVYCQAEQPREKRGSGEPRVSTWRGIRLVTLSSRLDGPLGTISFDWRSVGHALRGDSLVLTLGYNTAAFGVRYRMAGMTQLINMDGIEWKRDKWPLHARVWLRLNEWLGARLATHLIADHPAIGSRLSRLTRLDRITMIPYGADAVETADPGVLRRLGLEPGRFLTVIARPEPENSLLEIVQAFSAARRHCRLVVLGQLRPDRVPYHARVQAVASDEVVFPGAIYDGDDVAALRLHCRAYLHGHRVGGTNPSLVEALGAGCPVIAHDNVFNRWVAGEAGRFFRSMDDLRALFDALLEDPTTLTAMGREARARHRARFTWARVLGEYEVLLERYVNA
jgi:glycosyltransferase involved in cell wall biosynthesis